MIDLHCHLLPDLDDGAEDIAESLAMARIAVDDGIQVVACTPHIHPGLYNNTGPSIRAAVDALSVALADAGIDLRLATGADAHMAPGLAADLKSGRVLTLNDSRYFLFEPPHHVAPPRLEETLFGLMAAGYTPILTHPERLAWIESHYRTIERLAAAGVWMQLTAGSVTGRFGSRAQYWSERLLDDGIVHLLCSDAHDTTNRAPRMSNAVEMIARRSGNDTAQRLVWSRPIAVLMNMSPTQIDAADRDGSSTSVLPVSRLRNDRLTA